MQAPPDRVDDGKHRLLRYSIDAITRAVQLWEERHSGCHPYPAFYFSLNPRIADPVGLQDSGGARHSGAVSVGAGRQLACAPSAWSEFAVDPSEQRSFWLSDFRSG